VRLARPVKQVIFDLDGVLLDTEPLYTQSIAAVAARFGKGYDWTVKSQCIGRGTFDAADIIVRALDLPLSPEELVRERDLTLVGLLATALAMPGAQDLTRALALRGVPMAIATSTEAALYAVKATPHREWLTIFRAVVCGDDARVRRPKPAPDIFLAAAADLSAQPADCLVFEDSPFGVEAALDAGMQVIALPDPAMDRDRYRRADIVARGFADVTLAALGF
jgi:pseudouridine-5'-monophosphatase